MKLDRERYSIIKRDGKYCLYDTDQLGRLTPNKYVGYLTKKGNNYYLPNGNKVVNLEQQLADYEQSLPYNVEYYNPTYREGIFEEFVIHRWLIDNNFKDTHDNNYSLSVSNIVGNPFVLNFTFVNMDADGHGKNIRIQIWKSDFSWSEFECDRTPESFIQVMSYILNVFAYSQIASLMSMTSSVVDFDNIDMSSMKITNKLDIVKNDFRQELKSKLQDLIDKL